MCAFRTYVMENTELKKTIVRSKLRNGKESALDKWKVYTIIKNI